MTEGEYKINPSFPEKSCVDTVSRVVFSYRPIDETVRNLRRAAYTPEFMAAMDQEGRRYYMQRIKEIMDGVDKADPKHPLTIEVKKIVISFYRVVAKFKGTDTSGDLPWEGIR